MKGTTLWQYSTRVFLAFGILIVSYIIIFYMLYFVEKSGAITFTSDINGDLLKLTTTLPFVAFYVLVLVGATAGIARSAVMARELPFGKHLSQELTRKTMKGASIITKIRGGATITQDTSYGTAVNSLIAARVPILPILEDKNKVKGVLTYYDIVKQLHKEIVSNPNTSIRQLSNLLVGDIDREESKAVTVTESDNFKTVLNQMIKNKYNRLIVVKDQNGNAFSGIVDVFDITSELLDSEENIE